jgi:putative endopeptidase
MPAAMQGEPRLNSKSIFALGALLLCASLPAAPADSPPVSGIQAADMNKAGRPQNDLYDYANGAWLRRVQIPPDRSRYGVDVVMTEQSLAQLHELIEAARSSSDPDARKVADLYDSFMDEARIEQQAARPLQPQFESIDALKRVEDLAPLMAQFGRLGLSMPFDMSVQPDSKRSTQYALWFSQGGLGLPDRDYYLSDDQKLLGFRKKYREHIAKMLTLLGDAHAADEAGRIIALETAMARIQWTRVANRDPQKTYNPQTLAQLKQLAPSMDWSGYFAKSGAPDQLPTLIVQQPDYLGSLSGLITATPLTTWKEYLRFRVLSDSAPYLSRAFVDEDFAFTRGVLQGTPKNQDRWKRGCELVDQLIGEASGKLYVAKYFPPKAKTRIDELVANMLKAYAQSVDQLSWMSEATKVEARAKLAKINVKVGYPKRWRNYAKLVISPSDLIGNLRRGESFEYNRKLAQLGGPIDRDEWLMTTPAVNAYYDPQLNEIVFPAGILQLPVFNPDAEGAFNYGATGAVIGHEISHGFDDEGSQFDSDGNLRDWWTAEDHAKFKTKTDKLIKEYSRFEPVPGFHVNGELTLGENIADIAGIEIAYKAYVASLNGSAPPVIDGMSADQRFYLGYAQSWLSKTRDAATIEQVKSDPHSPEKYRVNGVVVHMPSFYDAFSVKSGDKMYLRPEDRITLW